VHVHKRQPIVSACKGRVDRKRLLEPQLRLLFGFRSKAINEPVALHEALIGAQILWWSLLRALLHQYREASRHCSRDCCRQFVLDPEEILCHAVVTL
jgi:hypothetical protein